MLTQKEKDITLVIMAVKQTMKECKANRIAFTSSSPEISINETLISETLTSCFLIFLKIIRLVDAAKDSEYDTCMEYIRGILAHCEKNIDLKEYNV